jgi:hypothetical protein
MPKPKLDKEVDLQQKNVGAFLEIKITKMVELNEWIWNEWKGKGHLGYGQ